MTMTAIVPDTLQGAVIINIIDFFLSFVIISGIGVVLSFFPLLNRVASLTAKKQPATSPAAKQPAAVLHQADSEAHDDDIAAIAAAVLVIMDGAPHRILHIDPAHHGAGWVAEGRQSHHGSHRPRT